VTRKNVCLESSVVSHYANRRSRDLIVAAYQEITRESWQKELPKVFRGWAELSVPSGKHSPPHRLRRPSDPLDSCDRRWRSSPCVPHRTVLHV
jgi:hypothetical protein